MKIKEDWEDLSWRHITEYIRHVTIVFYYAFLIAVFDKGYSGAELFKRGIRPTSLSNIFCGILAFSVPIYWICVIIDTIDDMNVSEKKGFFRFLLAFVRRLFYDLTYIFHYFKRYIVTLLILIAISAIGLKFLL